MTRQPGPACGNNPNHPMSDGDRRVVDDFQAYLAQRATIRDRIAAALHQDQTPPPVTPWEDEAPLDREYFQRRADAVLAVLPAAPAAPGETAEAVLAVVETALGDTLAPDARVEALAGITALLPAATGHDTDTSVTPPPALTEEGRLRARVHVLEEAIERADGLAKVGARCMRDGHQGRIESGRAVVEGHRFALSVKLGLGTGAPWDAIHEQVAELRRVADETAADRTEARVTITVEMLAGALAAHTDLLIGALGEGVASIAVVPTEIAGMRRTIDLLKLHKSRLLNLQEHADLIRRLGPFLAAFTEEPAAGARQDGAQG